MSVIKWFKTNFIFTITSLVAIISCFFVPINSNYLTYFNGAGQTLTCIFSILIIVAGLQNINFFQKISKLIVKRFKTTRSIILALILITYISALINANDMALLTFLPLSFVVLKYTNNTKYLAITFIMQNVASNLGGMISPIGNPQNIYLFAYYKLSLLEFIKIMAIPTLCALFLIILICMFIKSEPIKFNEDCKEPINIPRLIVYTILFVLTFLILLNIVPFYIGLIIVVATMLICDYKAFKNVDYTIPLTFVAFFIFSGNMSNIPTIINFMKSFADKQTFLCGYLFSQIMSNVPATILISKFTNNYAQLLVSVNVASLGIIFSSLSGVIALKCFIKYSKETKNQKGAWYYIGLDLLVNIGMLIILYPVSYFALLL